MRWWKLLGLAGLMGVAASGVVIARGQRQRRAYTPEQVRARLHARLAEASAAPAPGTAATHAATDGTAATDTAATDTAAGARGCARLWRRSSS